MKTTLKRRAPRLTRKVVVARRKAGQPVSAALIRQIGDEWAKHWNAGDLDKVVATYAPDAVYLPPHHVAVHGKNAIREYLQTPLSHGVTGLAFYVTSVKHSGNIAWDVGTYRMTVPHSDGTTREDHGKYLTVWKRVGTKWLIAADAWSSDLPPLH